MAATEHVLLVDENDQPLGPMEKLAAHQKGLCHRAFSVFIFSTHDTPALLLQQRAEHKYHSGGLWTNTCCSHPRPDEDIILAGERRLFEEMGIRASLTTAGTFHYIAHFDNGLIENELDHVLVGRIDECVPPFNPLEVQSYRWVEISSLQNELREHPERFTAWLAQALEVARKSRALSH